MSPVLKAIVVVTGLTLLSSAATAVESQPTEPARAGLTTEFQSLHRAIADLRETFAGRYPDADAYLKRLAELEALAATGAGRLSGGA